LQKTKYTGKQRNQKMKIKKILCPSKFIRECGQSVSVLMVLPNKGRPLVPEQAPVIWVRLSKRISRTVKKTGWLLRLFMPRIRDDTVSTFQFDDLQGQKGKILLPPRDGHEFYPGPGLTCASDPIACQYCQSVSTALFFSIGAFYAGTSFVCNAYSGCCVY